MAENSNNWGGKRFNAGRKPKDVKVVSFTMEIELANKLPAGINRSKFLNDCVREKLQRDGQL